MNNKCRGFTLLELVITVAIIGILASVAYPSYVQHVRTAQCADGMDSLLSLAGRMEEFYLNNDDYTAAGVNAAGTGTVGSNQTSEGLYTLAITNATPFLYTLTATPVNATAGLSTLTLNSLGQWTDNPVDSCL